MTGRERALVGLLERYQDLVEPWGGSGSSGLVGVPLMPPTYTGDVRELERLLGVMRVQRRDLWWHVNEHFLAVTWVVRELQVRRRVRRGKYVVDLERQVVRLGDGSDPGCVGDGLAWLARHWGLDHEPMLPREMLV